MGLIFPTHEVKQTFLNTLLNAQSVMRFSSLAEGAGWRGQALFLVLCEYQALLLLNPLGDSFLNLGCFPQRHMLISTQLETREGTL